MLMKLERNELIIKHVTHARACVWETLGEDVADRMLQSTHVSVDAVIGRHPSVLSSPLCC